MRCWPIMTSLPSIGSTCGPRTRSRALSRRCGTGRSARKAASVGEIGKVPVTGLRVASLLDLAGIKAAVVQRRAEAKDYIDIAAILSEGSVNLPLALASAQAIYGAQFNPQNTLKALVFFEEGNL